MPPRFPVSIALPLLPTASSARCSETQAKLHDEIAALFDLFRDPLLRYLRTFGLEIQDCEEALQETFLALFRHRHRGRSIDNVRSWLFRVAHNQALRRRMRSRRDAEMPLDTAGDIGALEPNPEDLLAGRQARERVAAVVEALPEQDRRCLFLRAEGLRYREISEILDMSLGAVSLSLTRSLARIARSAER
jgi:RNA polymerase sigma-70 factor (ECF subfamily)